MGLFSRLRLGGSAASPRAARRALPPPGVLRREKKALQRARETELRDLGGLLLEMYRQDDFREDLLQEGCARLLELDERLFEVDGLLAALRRGLPPGRCTCGAPLLWNSHFCANCGRPAGEAVVACRRCGGPLAADTSFCPRCATPVRDDTLPAAEEPVSLELEAPGEPELEAAGESELEPAPDSLER
jgi:hypothetical protein